MRIFFCADVKYPHGVAGANRVQYVAKLLKQCGHEVIVLSSGTTKNSAMPNQLLCDDEINYTSLPVGENRVQKFLNSKIVNGKNAVAWLKGKDVSINDIIYIYASNCLYVEPIYNFVKKRNLKAIIDVVEWHQPFQYKYGIFNYRYQSVNRTFKKITHKFGNVIAISEFLYDRFTNKGCNTFRLPMIIDTHTVQADIDIVSNKDHVDLIYQGNPCREDFASMLKAMVFLKENGEGNFVFHTTGVKESFVRKELGSDAFLVDRLGENIIFHGWLDYDELQGLFNRMDFLFMSRYNDLVRKANFPSKLPECMARGIVPICNRVGDYWKYLSDKDSILFDDSNEHNCIRALRQAMAMSREKLNSMKKNAVVCAQKNFDYREWADRLNEYVLNL